MSLAAWGLAALVALVVSSMLSAAGKAIGKHIGLVDIPEDNGLKIHFEAAVPLGGLGVAAGAYLGFLSVGLLSTAFLLGSLLMWLIGLLDDFRGLNPLTRLVAATGAGLLIVSAGLVPWSWLPGLAALLVVIASVNAVNLLDGLDALAGSVTTVCLVGLAILALTRGMPVEAGLSAVAAAATVGFLFWNLPPAKLFLGDNGAYFIGIVLAWSALRLATDWTSGAVAVAIIGVPFLDLGITVVRRMRTGAQLFGGDRDHTYDRLHQRGWSPGRIAVSFTFAQALWSALIVTTAAAAGNGPAIAVAVSVGLAIVLYVGLRE